MSVWSLTSTLIGAGISQAALVDGLRNYWDFDNNLTDQAHSLAGSASTAADNGAVVSGGTLTYGTGQFGGSLLTNGTGGNADSHVVIGGLSDDLTGYAATDVLTISGWVQANALETGWQTVLAKGEQSEYRVARSGGTNNLAYAGGNGDITGTGDPLANTPTGWIHFVAISNGASGTELWLNGALSGSNTDPANIIEDGKDLFIGANPEADTGSHFREWNGNIDDVAMWDRALDSTEIAEIYNGGVAGASLGQLIPEPSSGLLGLLGIGLILRRRR